ncbi:tRNA pseudouridine(38-40) synthase TruA [Kaistia dalseonensis]|uniref:tRNA pseudouridine synthase A n=1 Tax=Kaistia dalseonensis TaxID=410840 RepID=A0ABU0H9J0_9HYPH|nr:tRNA pseudouridine(38-40) synthase TruA [Kaistia dalseonensis]MCX5496342.1 tRNA pseudouridine(38-40) synthase TruA [Kaistia dalseonensis]MDQ0438962.1 tRNA pseudouridine38-40 synthase [Kaistia dalseonensis]
MPRYKILIEYDGTPYAGWQRQGNAPSVQQTIEEAIFRFSGEEVSSKGAGRTDTGVHALGQVAHFDLSGHWRGDRIRDAMNAQLRPAPIAILEAHPVSDDFDARYSATKRHYVYRVTDRRAPAALDINRVWDVRKRLDIEAMREGAAALIGHHDFTTFRSADCQALSPMKTLERLEIHRHDDSEIWFEVSARSFLHNQVRSMVGTLKKVGEGKWPPSAVGDVLEARDRKACGPVAPPGGLYLTKVDYGSKAKQPVDDLAEDEA